MSELAFLSAIELAKKIKAREISSEELLSHYLDRVDRYNGDINAIVVEMRDQALTRAREADKALASGEDWGPLHGLPMTCKESYDVAGTPTTRGSPDLKDNIAETDALAITRLKKAGAVFFGKTNVPLALADFQSYNDVYGTTNNPWDLSRTPGGSSGGSAAALAAGMTGLEIGSDIGGSIRNPAFFCGVFGHKPTWGLLPPRGHAMPGSLAPTDISVIGPLSRSAYDLDTAVNIMAGPDEIMADGYVLNLRRLEKDVADLKVAVWRDDDYAPVDQQVSARVDRVAQALKDLGATINYDARPDFKAEHTHVVYQSLLSATMAARLPKDQYQHSIERADAIDPEDKSLNATITRSRVARFAQWSEQNENRTRLRWAWHEFFRGSGRNHFDVLLTPIMAAPAFLHDHRPMRERTIMVNDQEQDYFKQMFWAGLTCNAYLPSTVIPTGPNANNLPIGVQIAGPEYGDLITIGIAKLLEHEGFEFTPPAEYST
jgi:amidase